MNEIRNNFVLPLLKSAFTLTLGGLVGAGIALLYAPQSGRATRGLLQYKGQVLKDRVSGDVDLAKLQVQRRLNHMNRSAQIKMTGFKNQLQDNLEARRTS
jgi:gas vesicle protein